MRGRGLSGADAAGVSPCVRNMEIFRELNEELLRQPFGDCREDDEVEACRRIASMYASTEGAIAVLSDLGTGRSRIYYGGLAATLGVASCGKVEDIPSIWETEILGRIHPDDLVGKQLNELRFFRMLKLRSERLRRDYCLFEPLRMRNRTGHYVPIVHRILYLSGGADGCVRMTLCLYNAASILRPERSTIVCMSDGRSVPLERQGAGPLLTSREREVLRLIGEGASSKEIARRLSIAVHTVNRHRQNILGKLQVRNSVEACRLAERLRLL